MSLPQSLAAMLLALFLAAGVAAADNPGKVDFNFDVKPILSDRCFVCHGPSSNNREAELRLDTREGLFGESQYGEASHIVKPGSIDDSELIRRLVTEDASERMPPEDSKLSLTDEEVGILRRWVEQGGTWTGHWSFIPPEDTPVPAVRDGDWPINSIDSFVLARLEREDLSPSATASRERLLRRLTFDLTGLPPTLEELDAFLADESPAAYERQVDRLLASPRFGERMAVDWLDVARYADTYGYQSDVYRAVWPYRDWVVQAFNENLPYDQFITWQLAGDLLPDAGRDPILATAFNRLHRQTNEGGSIEEEFRAEYASDRTDTLGAAFLGLTLGCARCHEHKYDPISQQDYYRLFSFFNNIDECGLYSHFTDATPTPTLLLATDPEQTQMEELAVEIERAEEALAELQKTRRKEFESWLDARPAEADVPGLIGDFPLESIDGGKLENRADAEQPGKVTDNPQVIPGRMGNGLLFSGDNSFTTPVGGDFTRSQAFSIALWINTPDIKQRAVVFHRSRAWTDAGSRGYQLLLENGCLSASLIHFWPGNAMRIRMREPIPVEQWVHVVMAYDGSSRADGLTLYVDGQSADCEIVRDKLRKNITGGGANELALGQRFRDRGFKNGRVDELKVFARCVTPIEATQLFDGSTLDQCLATATDALDSTTRKSLFGYYLENFDEPYRSAQTGLTELRQQRNKLVDSIPEIMVMREMPERRPTYLLKRGAYDAPGERVFPDAPSSILPFDDSLPRNRLGLARWLTDPRNPLTARVAVNRFWQRLFGRGLVGTPEDFGSQGELPSHPQLLDWLARQFVESGWDVKRLVKLAVMSATYRQDSLCPPELLARDPENRLLARGSRYRFPAEMIRDAALTTSGLWVERMGGAPVKPYQPAGLWKEKFGRAYQRDAGDGSHRRSLYTYWKRTSPPPAMMTLDAAKRDVCAVKRQTTQTPLQALVLLNDPQYVEAARALAERCLLQGGEATEDRLRFAFRLLTSRLPDAHELAILDKMYQEQLREFGDNEQAADDFLAIGDHRGSEELPSAELAAMTVVATALLNFDETVMKR